MAHSLTPTAPAIAIPISTRSKHSPLSSQRVWACHRSPDQTQDLNHVNRRSLALGLVGGVLGLNEGDRKANAARRPPPPPPQEKKDPNVSGVMAKVLASKKRKEAMKEYIAKLREKGKPIQEPSE